MNLILKFKKDRKVAVRGVIEEQNLYSLLITPQEVKLMVSKEGKIPEIAKTSEGMKIPTFLIIIVLAILYKLFCGDHFKRQVQRLEGDD